MISQKRLVLRLLWGIGLASLLAAIGSLAGFLLMQRVIFPDFDNIFGLRSFVRYELPFYPLVTYPILLALWRFAPPHLISYALPATLMGLVGSVFSIEVRRSFGDNALEQLIVEMGTRDGEAGLLITAMFCISSVPIALFASLAAWATLHVWVRVPSPQDLRAADNRSSKN